MWLFKKKEKDKDEKIDTYPIKTTDLSGKEYTFTSGSVGTATFTNISDAYEKNPNAVIPKSELVVYEYITIEDLELYVELGYLERVIVGSEIDAYILTEKGREALKWNREFKKKWHKNKRHNRCKRTRQKRNVMGMLFAIIINLGS